MNNTMQQVSIPTSVTQLSTLSEAEIKRELGARDRFGDIKKAVLYEAVTDPVTGKEVGLLHIMNPYEKEPIPVTLPTDTSKADVEAILAKVSPTEETCKIFCHLAECYQVAYPACIQAGTGVGKTFTVDKFTELLFGKGIKPLDFYCSGQTDVSELMGRWVPAKGVSAEVTQRWESFVQSPHGTQRLEAIDQAVDSSGMASPEDKAKMYRAMLQQLAKEVGLGNDSQFEFEYGAVPKMFMGEVEEGRFRVKPEGRGKGFILHVQEVGLAKPAVINALLRLRGENGELAQSFQLWELDGQTIYKGPKAFLVFTTNPIQGYMDRKPLDAALTRGLEVLNLGETVSTESMKMTARKIFTYSLGNDVEPVNKHAMLDLRKAPEVGEAIGAAMVAIHEMLSQHFNLGESDDPQRMPVVMDNLFKVATFMQNYQVKGPSGSVDVGKTLFRAISRTYLERAKPEDRPDIEKQVTERIFGKTSEESFEGKSCRLNDKLNTLAARALDRLKRAPAAPAAPAATAATAAPAAPAATVVGAPVDGLKPAVAMPETPADILQAKALDQGRTSFRSRAEQLKNLLNPSLTS